MALYGKSPGGDWGHCAHLPAGYFEFYQPRQPHRNHQQQQLSPDPPRVPPLSPQRPQGQPLMQYFSDLSSIIDYSKLISFLEIDHSFLTPWNWKPDDDDDADENTSGFNNDAPENATGLNNDAKKYMKFDAGSLFSVQPPIPNKTG